MKIAVFNISSSTLFLPHPLNLGLKAGEKRVLSVKDEDWAAINKNSNIQRVIRAKLLRIGPESDTAPKTAVPRPAPAPEPVAAPEPAPEPEAPPAAPEPASEPTPEPEPTAEHKEAIAAEKPKPQAKKTTKKKKKVVRKKKAAKPE